MASSFVPYERDQQMLLPPSIADWVPEGHPVRFVTDAVEVLDLSAFVARHPLGGVGRRAYHPAMMVGLLLWAYSNGVFSSREIERRCETDVAFRFIAANEVPDHTTIARFRATRAAELKALHVQVLVLCAELGLTSLGLVALDGTKMKANASKDANRSEAWLSEQIDGWFNTAAAADDADDDRFGDGRGDEVPADVRRQADRVERMRQARDRLRVRDQARQRARRVPDGDRGPTGNVTDPDSSLMPVRGGGWVQGYNAQTVANPAGIVLWTEVFMTPVDARLFIPALAGLHSTLRAAGIDGPVGTVVADAGYWSEANANAEVAATETLIATDRHRATTAAKAAAGLVDPPAVDVNADLDRRADILARWLNGQLDRDPAIAELGLARAQAYVLRARFRDGGIDGIRLAKAANGHGQPRCPVTNASRVKHQMRQRLASEEGKARYRMRAPTIEGVFGNVKHNRKFRAFTRRGQLAVDAEWTFVNTAGNLTKLRRALQALTAGLAGPLLTPTS